MSEYREFATDDEIEQARAQYAEGSDDNIEFDAPAKVSIGNCGIWVQAWVWLSNKEDEDA